MSSVRQSVPVAPGVGLVGIVLRPCATMLHVVPPSKLFITATVVEPLWLPASAYTTEVSAVGPRATVRFMRPTSPFSGTGNVPDSRADVHVAPPSVLFQMSPRLPRPVAMPGQVATKNPVFGWLNDGGYPPGQA